MNWENQRQTQEELCKQFALSAAFNFHNFERSILEMKKKIVQSKVAETLKLQTHLQEIYSKDTDVARAKEPQSLQNTPPPPFPQPAQFSPLNPAPSNSAFSSTAAPPPFNNNKT
jgi:hypothetical protein